jgi:TonB family protein
MARDSIFESDSDEDNRCSSPRLVSVRESSSDPLAAVAAKIRQQGGEELAPDLALDLVLHEMIEEVRSITIATGAAVALWRGNVMVCRATAGTTAPDLGTPLDISTGLSGICIQSRSVQICTDAVGDSRVDEEVCRRLGVRSILVYPLLAGNNLLGILEIFSPRPHAFGERDEETVRGFAERIVRSVLQSRQAAAQGTAEPEKVAQESEGEQAPPHTEEKSARTPRDYLTPILILLVIAVAVLLGWVLGRAGWLRISGFAERQSSSIVKSGAARSSLNPHPSTAKPVKPVSPETTDAPAMGKEASSAAKETVQKKPFVPGSLTVYQDGKVIFHIAPSQSSQQTTSSGADSLSHPATVSPEIARGILIYSVEPKYPEEALARHIEGPVVLDILVNREGLVQQLSVLNGPSELASTAINAVRQWRFRPYQPNGFPVEFETRITVNFALPK